MQVVFEGLNVVVTGGTGALGGAVIQLLSGSGARCFVPSISSAAPGGQFLEDQEGIELSQGVDLTREEEVRDYYGSLPDLWASIHCAGGFALQPIGGATLGDFEDQLKLNAVTCFLCCREAVLKLRERRGRQGGRIVNVSSRPALEPRSGAGMIAYTASKAAVAAITQSLGEEVAKERIWVNAVVPSVIDTPANRRAMPDADYSLWPEVSDVAAAIAYLASPQNRSVRSSLVTVYGRS